VTFHPSNDPARAAHQAWLRALEATAAIARNDSLSFPVLIDRQAATLGSMPALLSARESLTYAAFAERARRYARWACAQNITAGRVLCLLMTNCLDYAAIWLGVTRVGGRVALLNTHLTHDSLMRAVAAVDAHHIVVGADLARNVVAVRSRLAPDIEVWGHGPGGHPFRSLEDEIAGLSGEALSSGYPQPALGDPALYVYTSGTTGFPKAAVISHRRLMQWTHWFAGMMDLRATDRVYNCLPMYHGVGGIVALGAPLVRGASVLIRQGFSAASFWNDVTAWNCTVSLYTGEVCRYLVTSPPRPCEREHPLRLMCGNGLRPDVWTALKDRFAIPHILEFYAATESNVSLYNCEEKPGAVGRIPTFLSHRFPVALVRHDVASGEPVRDASGFCVPCSIDEPGEAIGRIAEAALSPGARFEGYSDADASARKILRDVFAKGDAWFRTGDLLRKDAAGYFYFVDRIGDTFRWKGENVSTSEVADVIGACAGVRDAVVYGVTIPGTEGHAGMATIVVDQDFELAALHRYVSERLPAYARPLLLRIAQHIENTGTFKLKKLALAREGFGPGLISDSIYFDDARQRAFLRLDAALYDELCSGRLRL
jgi:fatty-acyl-CoA synthase